MGEDTSGAMHDILLAPRPAHRDGSFYSISLVQLQDAAALQT